MKKFSLVFLVILAMLAGGCSKSSETVTPENPNDQTTITIPVKALYEESVTISNNVLTLSVAGQPDLYFPVTPNQDVKVMITGESAKSRLNKTATLTMSCQADIQGVPVPVTYNHPDGKTELALQSSNPKVEWVGQTGTTGDQIIIRVKITFQYSSPGEYTVTNGGFALYVDGQSDLNWPASATADTIIIITGQAAKDRLGKPFGLVYGCNAIDYFGNYAQICYNYQDGGYNGQFRGDALAADNPKVEFIGHHCN